MRALLLLAARSLARHPWRSSATALGMALGIAAVLATLSVGANVQANLRAALEAAAGRADLMIIPGASGRAVFSSEEVLPVVEGVTGVSRVYPVLHRRAEPIRNISSFDPPAIPGIDSGFQLSGRITTSGEDLPVRTTVGTLPTAGSWGIALANGFAEARGLTVGDVVGFATQFGEVPFEIKGLLDSGFGYASTNGGRVGVVHLSDLQEAFHLGGRISFLEVHLEPGASLEGVKASLEEVLGATHSVTLPVSSGDFIHGLTETLQSGLTVLAAALMALGAFMAYNTFTTTAVERTREYALLRTICLKRREVRLLALMESGIVGVLGIVGGLLLGILLSYALTRFHAWTLGFEFRTLKIPLQSTLLASALGTTTLLLASWFPARAASNTPPMVAVRAAYIAPNAPPRLGLGLSLLILGVAAALAPWEGIWAIFASAVSMGLLFTGLVLLTPIFLNPVLVAFRPLLRSWLGIPGRLGAGLALRNAVRNRVAIGSVVLGMGLTIGVGAVVAGINRSIRDWVDTTVVGDLFVTTPVSFPQDFEEQALAKIPGLGVISGVGLRAVRFQPEGASRGRTVALVLVDPERFSPDDGFGSFHYIQGQGDNRTGYAALRKGGAVLAANTILEKFNVGLGAEVELRTSEGFRTFPVSGVVVDFTGGGESFVGSIHDLDLFGGGSPDLYVMTVADGVQPEEVRANLLATFPELFLDVTLHQAYREQIQSLTQRSFLTTNALLVLAIFVAALSVANTLGMNLSSRRHEVALLRTIGLTRRGVASMITAEGVVVIFVGTLLGVGVGLLLSKVITVGASELTGFVIEAIYPWRLVFLAFVSSPLVGLLAAHFPARRASRLVPTLALNSRE